MREHDKAALDSFLDSPVGAIDLLVVGATACLWQQQPMLRIYRRGR